MEFVNGDITEVTSGIICHQVNCQGVMGAGVALAIRRKWGAVYPTYRKAYINDNLQLGNVIYVVVGPGLIVANLCGQNRYGRIGIYTDYEALHKTIQHVSETRVTTVKQVGTQIPVYFPNRMGCCLAGGDWNIVIRIIGKYIPDAKIVNYVH